MKRRGLAALRQRPAKRRRPRRGWTIKSIGIMRADGTIVTSAPFNLDWREPRTVDATSILADRVSYWTDEQLASRRAPDHA